MVDRGGGHAAAVRRRPAPRRAAALLVAIRADARQLSGDRAGRLPGSGRRAEPDATPGDRGGATARGERTGCAGADHLDPAVRGRTRQLSERVGCAGAGTCRANRRGPTPGPPDAGDGVADPGVGRRMDSASAAQRTADAAVRTARLWRAKIGSAVKP